MRRDFGLDLVSLSLAGPQALWSLCGLAKGALDGETDFGSVLAITVLSGFGKFLPFWPFTSVSEDSSAECARLLLTLTFCEEYFDSSSELPLWINW